MHRPTKVIAQSNGIQKIYRFPNGYGASVIMNTISKGFEDGLWELAVVYFKNNQMYLTYNTPITSDVIGYLTDQDVESLLIQIENLEK